MPNTVPNPPKAHPTAWNVIGHTVRGASHIQHGVGNQDSIGWKEDHGRVVLAVADGHGSAKSFRSDLGSRFAVRVSIKIASDLLQAEPARAAAPTHQEVWAANRDAHRKAAAGDRVSPPVDDRLLSLVKDRLEIDIPRRIVYDWTRLVEEDLARSPLSEGELSRLAERDGAESRRRVEQNGHLAYGSTLVTVVAMDSFVVLWQIGDGDVLTVSRSGKVGRPVPHDPRLLGNETTSLCSPDAARMFRRAILGTPPPMIMLSTDGFANSFQDEAGFFKFGTDVRDIISTDGLEQVQSSLDDWLNQITHKGSGDDISLGIVCRPSELAPIPQTVPDPRDARRIPEETVVDPGLPREDPAKTLVEPRDQAHASGQELPATVPADTRDGDDVNSSRKNVMSSWLSQLRRSK